MNTYAYARVSTRDQNEERQLIALEVFGVERTHMLTSWFWTCRFLTPEQDEI